MKILIFLCVTVVLNAQILQGKVIGVMDGDTIKILTSNKKQYKIRLSNIDAPEKRQAYGNKSKWFLSDLIYRKNVTVQYSKRDRYGRVIGRVYLGNMDINKEMVQNGYAWVYRRYSKDTTLIRLEDYARSNQVGLWKDSNPIYPSTFRRSLR